MRVPKMLNESWKEKMMGIIISRKNGLMEDNDIDFISPENIAIRWLIVQLTTKGLLYKVYNLGAGVKRVTTDTDKCPCCKKEL